MDRITNLSKLSHTEKDSLIGRLFDELDVLRSEVKDLRG